MSVAWALLLDRWMCCSRIAIGSYLSFLLMHPHWASSIAGGWIWWNLALALWMSHAPNWLIEPHCWTRYNPVIWAALRSIRYTRSPVDLMMSYFRSTT